MSEIQELNRIKVMLVEKHRTSRWLAKELGKGNTSDSRVQSIIKKKKYEPIRGIVEESLTLRKAK